MVRSPLQRLFVGVLTFSAAFWVAAVAWASVEMPMIERRLTVQAAVQTYPAISGNKVVYQDWRNNSNIYLHDLATGSEKPLTTIALNQNPPKIWGNRVVYEDNRSGNRDIYLYDLTTGKEKRLTTNAGNQWDPEIWGSRVVYEDSRNGNSDIYLYDVATGVEKRLTTNTSRQWMPAISGSRVVYVDERRGDADADIYLYDLTTGTEKRLTTNTSNQYNPAISGSKVVYEDIRSGTWQIYLYDLDTNTEKQLTKSLLSHELGPRISGSNVVYFDDRGGDNNIYLYDLEAGAEIRLTANPNHQRYPAIEGDRVVYRDDRNGNAEIYLGELIRPRISASAPAVVAYGGRAKLTGSLFSVTGIPIAGRGVVLQVSSDGSRWSDAGTFKTNSAGAFTLTSPVLTSARWVRANFRGSDDYLSAQSVRRLVKPKVSLTRPSFGATTLTFGKRYTASGYLKPKHTAGTSPVKIYAYRYSNGKYRYVKSYSAKASNYSSYTKYSRKIELPKRGKWRLRAAHAQDALNALTYSSWRYVVVK